MTAALVLLRRVPRGSLPPTARYLIAAAVFTYLPWMSVFGIYRYIVPLEMLAPMLTVAALSVWPLSRRPKRILIVTLLVLLTVTARPGEWLHAPWQDGPFV